MPTKKEKYRDLFFRTIRQSRELDELNRRLLVESMRKICRKGMKRENRGTHLPEKSGSDVDSRNS